MLSIILYAIGILIVFSIPILLHELGHFMVAKKSGVMVEEFGFGLPPRLFGKKIGETIYSVNLFPIGGFVRLSGELSEEGVKDKSRSFMGKGKIPRFLIIAAGILMNLVLGLVCFAIVYSFLGIPKEQGYVQIISVSKDSPAAVAGLAPNDVIMAFDKNPVKKSADFTNLTRNYKGKTVQIEIKRGSQVLNLNVTLRENPADGKSFLGVVVSSQTIYYPPIYERPFYGAYYGTIAAYQTTIMIAQGLGGIVTEASHGQVPQDTAGPVGILAFIYTGLQSGILEVLNLMGIISLNLAVLNVIPIPPLDGSRLFSIVLEGIFGRRILPKLEAVLQTAGFVVLVALILFISYFDVHRLIINHGFTGYVNSFLK